MMVWFPSAFADASELARLLYHAALWTGDRSTSVWMSGASSLRTHAREIYRSPSGERVARVSRALEKHPEQGEMNLPLDPLAASVLFEACLAEAPALLELGYPRDEPPVFRTRIPVPGDNSRRTVHQIRSAMHHIGGDFKLLRTLLRTGDSTHSGLDVHFSVWPPPLPRSEGMLFLRLGYRGQTVPSILQLDTSLKGYALLACWDLALRLGEVDGILPVHPDFGSFAEEVMKREAAILTERPDTGEQTLD